MSAELSGSGPNFQFERPDFLQDKTKYDIEITKSKGVEENSSKWVMEISYLGHKFRPETINKLKDSKLRITIDATKGDDWAREEFTQKLLLLNEAATTCLLPDGVDKDFSAIFSTEVKGDDIVTDANVRNLIADRVKELSPGTTDEISQKGEYVKAQTTKPHQPRSVSFIAGIIDVLRGLISRLIPGQRDRTAEPEHSSTEPEHIDFTIEYYPEKGSDAVKGEEPGKVSREVSDGESGYDSPGGVSSGDDSGIASGVDADLAADIVDVSGGMQSPQNLPPLPPNALPPLPKQIPANLKQIDDVVSACLYFGKRAVLDGEGNNKVLNVRDLSAYKSIKKTGAQPEALRYILKTLIASQANVDHEVILALYIKVRSVPGYSKELSANNDINLLDNLIQMSLTLAQSGSISADTLDGLIKQYNANALFYKVSPDLQGIPEFRSAMLAVGKQLVELKAGLEQPPNLRTAEEYIDLIGNGNKSVAEALIWGHRNNDATRDLFSPIILSMSRGDVSPEYKDNLLQFTIDYLDQGHSIPIHPAEKEALIQQINTLIALTGGDPALEEKAAKLGGLVNKVFAPAEAAGELVDVGEPVDYDFQALPVAQIYADLAAIMEEKFLDIDLAEFDRQGWNKDSTKEFATTNSANIGVFNRITKFLVFQVVRASEAGTTEEKQQQAAAAVKKVLELAQLALDNHNVSLTASIAGAIADSAVNRLIPSEKASPIKDLLNERDFEIMKQMGAMTSNEASYQTQRNEVIQSFLNRDRLVPYTGVYFTDLTFLDDGNPDRTADGLINGSKIFNIALIKKSIGMLQDNLREKPKAATATKPQLANVLNQPLETANELYDRSLGILPRGATPPTSPRVE